MRQEYFVYENPTLYQCFEWYSPEDGTFWKNLASDAAQLRQDGITAVWLPPAGKGSAGIHDVGYGVYDLYDLGEFRQKGTVRTKYGTKQEYIACLKALHDNGIITIADIVFNHRLGGDATEKVMARECDPEDRRKLISDAHEIEAWTKFTFPGRKGKYSSFTWDHDCFDGCDYDQKTKKSGIYLFDGKDWDRQVNGEYGTYDYLMGCDLDMGNPRVIQELKDWGHWFLKEVPVDGVRIDAMKHINASVIQDWVRDMRKTTGKILPAVGEYWSGDIDTLLQNVVGEKEDIGLFDVPLHFHFFDASHADGNFDMGSLYRDTLSERRPHQAVTFVNNHDTQPHQALESYIPAWFQPLAYACVLLREQGIPCVFAGDLNGIPHDGIAPCAELKTLLKLHRLAAYGPEIAYFDDADTVGFVRLGRRDHEDSGLVVVMTDRGSTSRKINCSKSFARQTLVDALGHVQQEVTVNEEGIGEFPVEGGSVSVYVTKAMQKKLAQPVSPRTQGSVRSGMARH